MTPHANRLIEHATSGSTDLGSCLAALKKMSTATRCEMCGAAEVATVGGQRAMRRGPMINMALCRHCASRRGHTVPGALRRTSTAPSGLANRWRRQRLAEAETWLAQHEVV